MNGETEKRLVELIEQVASLTGKSTAEIENFKKQSEFVNNKISHIENGFSELSYNIKELEKRLGQLIHTQQGFAQKVNQNIDAINNNLKLHESNISAHGSSLQWVRIFIIAILTSIAGVYAKFVITLGHINKILR